MLLKKLAKHNQINVSESKVRDEERINKTKNYKIYQKLIQTKISL